MILALAATAICALAVIALVVAERGRDEVGRFRWKPLASAAFIAVPLLGGALDAGPHPELARWIIAGLCLGALGDVALMFETEESFLAGLVAFLLGHVAYVVGFAQLVGVGAWFGGSMLPIVAGVGVAAAIVLRWLWRFLGPLRGAVIAYVAVISAMLLGGVAALRGGGAIALTAGAAVFYLSDLAVAREKFVGRDPWNRTVGLPLYYGAQLLFAWAIVPA